MNFKKVYFIGENQEGIKEVQNADVLGFAVSKEGKQYLIISSEKENVIFEAVTWDEHICYSQEEAEKRLEEITSKKGAILDEEK